MRFIYISPRRKRTLHHIKMMTQKREKLHMEMMYSKKIKRVRRVKTMKTMLKIQSMKTNLRKQPMNWRKYSNENFQTSHHLRYPLPNLIPHQKQVITQMCQL